jgi:hypothetical protein
MHGAGILDLLRSRMGSTIFHDVHRRDRVRPSFETIGKQRAYLTPLMYTSRPPLVPSKLRPGAASEIALSDRRADSSYRRSRRSRWGRNAGCRKSQRPVCFGREVQMNR